MNIWDSLFLQPLLNGLILFYKISGNLGIAIILFTVFIRVLLIPLTLPSLRAAQKMRELAPHLQKLKMRHKDDKKKLAQAQMELYRQHGVNPAAGCIPQIVQIVILIALYQAFLRVLSGDSQVVSKINEFLWSPLVLPENTIFTTHFLYLNLGKPDTFPIQGFPFPVPGPLILLAAVVQFVSSKMMMPEVQKEADVAKKTPSQTDDMMVSMQQSMLWLFPATTIFIGIAFPSGLVLYWFVFSLFQAFQQYFVSGWGGMQGTMSKILRVKNESKSPR